MLMSACVCPQNCIFIDIIGISLATPNMNWWNTQYIEILVRRNDWPFVVVVFEGWRWELRFDDSSSYRYGVIFFDVQFL